MALKLTDPNTNVQGAVRELQGYTVSLLAGTTADTKIDLAAIRAEDTIISVLENAAGTLTDVTGNTTIADIRASGTVQAQTIVAGDTVTIDGNQVYQAATGDNPGGPSQGPVGTWIFGIGASDTESATNLAAKINHRNGYNPDNGVTATSATDTVTVTAVLEGTVGNAITLATNSTTGSVVLSGATLTGGSDTGGVLVDIDTSTDQLVVSWYNRK